MRVEFAYAVSIPAAVEMLTACSKKSDGMAGAGESAVTVAKASASKMPVVVRSHAARLTGSIARLGKDNENGARLAVEENTTQGPTAVSQKIQLELDVQRIAPMANVAADSKGSADESAQTARASSAKTVAREATQDLVTGVRAILTNIKRVQPDGMTSGGMRATGGRPIEQVAAPGSRAQILGGGSVCTGKVGELAGSAGQNPVSSEAALVPSDMTQGTGFYKQDGIRSHTLVQSDAPFPHEALCVNVDAMKRAHSIDAPEVLAAMPRAGYNRITGHIAFDDKGDLKEGAITLYDFKDSNRAVLDAVEM
jgi:ABC-type branched-subunit amino acid transport system substrate-binding protein